MQVNKPYLWQCSVTRVSPKSKHSEAIPVMDFQQPWKGCEFLITLFIIVSLLSVKRKAFVRFPASCTKVMLFGCVVVWVGATLPFLPQASKCLWLTLSIMRWLLDWIRFNKLCYLPFSFWTPGAILSEGEIRGYSSISLETESMLMFQWYNSLQILCLRN